MNRQRVKFPWDLNWENETCKLKRSIPRERICNGLFSNLIMRARARPLFLRTVF